MSAERRLLAIAFGAVLFAAPSPVAGQTSDCNGSITGAVLGTFFVTIVLTAVILFLLWWFYLRHRFVKRGTNLPSQGFSNNALDSTDLEINFAADIQSKVNTGTDVCEELQAPKKTDDWGLPKVLQPYLYNCEIPVESVSPIKVHAIQRDLDFTIAQHGVHIFIKDAKKGSPLTHIKHLKEGMHIVGLSVAFQDWDLEVAARFIAMAAPFKPQLYTRPKPLFDVDKLSGVAVQRLGPWRSLGVNTETKEESPQPIQAAPEQPSDAETVSVSEEEPPLDANQLWTFDRTGEIQAERVLLSTGHSFARSKSSSSSSSGTRVGSPKTLREADMMTDVFRATPLHLDQTGFPLERQSPSPPQLKSPSEMSPAYPGVDPMRFTSSVDSYGPDSGLGSSHDYRNGPMPQISPQMPPSASASSPSHSSASSRAASVTEAPIECSQNPRVLAMPRQDHLSELSDLDRRIALNNIEIATLMLNDSHTRQLGAVAEGCSDSEPESAHEEPITASRKEEQQSAFWVDNPTHNSDHDDDFDIHYNARNNTSEADICEDNLNFELNGNHGNNLEIETCGSYKNEPKIGDRDEAGHIDNHHDGLEIRLDGDYENDLDTGHRDGHGFDPEAEGGLVGHYEAKHENDFEIDDRNNHSVGLNFTDSHRDDLEIVISGSHENDLDTCRGDSHRDDLEIGISGSHENDLETYRGDSYRDGLDITHIDNKEEDIRTTRDDSHGYDVEIGYDGYQDSDRDRIGLTEEDESLDEVHNPPYDNHSSLEGRQFNSEKRNDFLSGDLASELQREFDFGFENGLEDIPDDELSGVIDRLAESSGSEECSIRDGVAHLNIKTDETFA